jgi:hypothetical protein
MDWYGKLRLPFDNQHLNTEVQMFDFFALDLPLSGDLHHHSQYELSKLS